MPSVHAVLTCFNRRGKTHQCLEALFSQSVPENVSVRAVVVDDGSTDGTAEMLEACFPHVAVIQGDGSLYWCGGMRVGWRAAARADPDYYFLLNDDTYLEPHAVRTLLETAGHCNAERIAAGAVCDPATGAVSYGGVRGGRNFAPTGRAEACDTFNGNVVLIPRAVYMEMGILHGAYTHGMGDFDYGYQARRANIDIVQTPTFVGTCRRDHLIATGSWRDRSLSRLERLRRMQSPKGLPLREWVIYHRRNSGWRWPIYSCSPFIRVLLGL